MKLSKVYCALFLVTPVVAVAQSAKQLESISVISARDESSFAQNIHSPVTLNKETQ